MKKTFSLVLAAVLCISMLVGCSCRHVWRDATCVTPYGEDSVTPVEITFKTSAASKNIDSSTKSAVKMVLKYPMCNATTGVFEVTIENQKGAELPETGGIGTSIFYVLGSLLVVGCGIVLISKRRMMNK